MSFNIIVPHEFSSIPFPTKALKILIHELQSSGESGALSGQTDAIDAESDDGVCTHCVHHGSKLIARDSLGPRVGR